ncbi:MAG: HAMP domain-containing histidine kinase [Lachnospiraceae bacterium]|nr:HAMP domain-containing histidine kinase [Lachnospiraceae bacterium]
MYILIGTLILIIFALILYLWIYQRQVKNICRQLQFLNENNSNMLILREINHGGIAMLVNILNDFLIMRKKEKKEFVEKEKMIADIYVNLSHDIRTPLTSLDGYFQLLEESDDKEEQKRYVSVIRERITSLNSMLEELFTYTKLKNEAYQLELTTCCINEVLKSTIFSYYDQWMELQIVPEFHITEELLYIEANKEALGRVIRNIIKNGLDHGEKQICVSLKKENDRVCLEIRNQMKEKEEINISQVFERFYKADKSRNKSSTGLGLAIAKEFVIRMHGKIEAEIIEDMFIIRIEFCTKI